VRYFRWYAQDYRDPDASAKFAQVLLDLLKNEQLLSYWYPSDRVMQGVLPLMHFGYFDPYVLKR